MKDQPSATAREFARKLESFLGSVPAGLDIAYFYGEDGELTKIAVIRLTKEENPVNLIHKLDVLAKRDQKHLVNPDPVYLAADIEKIRKSLGLPKDKVLMER